MQRQKALLLMGPTATGKTDLAIMLANQYPVEIISVDSVLIYKDMNIGSAKPSIEQLNQVPHHLIDIISPLEKYSVAEFIDDVIPLIRAINARGKVPVLVGGTLMYYNALINGLSLLPVANSETRQYLESEALKFGWSSLHNRLATLDPVSALKIKALDKQRISRALEVYYLTGRPMSTLQQESKIYPAKDIDFMPLAIIPKQSRDILHERIARRFKNMLDNGLVEEIEGIRNKYLGLTSSHPSMRSVGYYQGWQYLDQQITLDELSELGIIATRQLAKRQITWLQGMNAINLDTDANLDFAKLKVNLDQAIQNSQLFK